MPGLNALQPNRLKTDFTLKCDLGNLSESYIDQLKRDLSVPSMRLNSVTIQDDGTRLLEKVEALETKVDQILCILKQIFGNHVMLNGHMIDISNIPEAEKVVKQQKKQ